jgi:OOP family OmpA-OmpF porin
MKRVLGVLVMAAASCAGATALAQDGRAYLRLALGQSQADIDCTGTTSCDDGDTAWKVFGGYQFNRHFALEAGYANLGEATASPFTASSASTWPTPRCA